MTYYLITDDPVPIWYVDDDREPTFIDPPVLDLRRHMQPANGRSWLTFRGVPIERLPAVILNGVDVDPTDSPIFCAEPDKAWEYARPSTGFPGPGVLYALHGGHLKPTFRQLPADAAPDEIAEVRKTYPIQYDDPNGGLYFSRLAGQRNTAYEGHSYWIPGDARAALLAIFLRGERAEVVEALQGVIRQH